MGLEPSGQLLGQHHRPVAASGAAHGDRQVRLPLLLVGGDEHGQQVLELVQEGQRLGAVEHVGPHFRLESAVGPQRLVPVGVGQEPAVEHEVDVQGYAVLEAEGHHRGLHGAGLLFGAEHLDQPGPQLVGVELTGVDDQVGPVAEGRQQLPLVGDGVDHPPGGLRVAAPRPLEPADEDVVGGVQVEDPHPVAGAQQDVDGRQHVVEVASAPSHHERHPLHLRPRPVDQLGDLGDEAGGHVVDDEPAQVLQGGAGRRRPGAGHAGH